MQVWGGEWFGPCSLGQSRLLLHPLPPTLVFLLGVSQPLKTEQDGAQWGSRTGHRPWALDSSTPPITPQIMADPPTLDPKAMASCWVLSHQAHSWLGRPLCWGLC